MKRGKLVAVDGLDGVGKGVFLNTFVEEAKKDGKRVFDVDAFEKKNGHLPSPYEIIGQYDLVKTSEPTYSGIGKLIREEYTTKGSNYSPRTVADAYALCRRILTEQLSLILLEAGIDDYRSRAFSAAITFQRQSALNLGEELSIAEIMSIPGNKYCAEHPMDHLVIPTIVDVVEAMNRIAQRDKDDNCKFENLNFQLKLKPHFESEEFKALFASLGVKLTYMDAGVSKEHSQQQAREFYQQHLK